MQVHDATEYIRKEINKMLPKPAAGGKKKGAAAVPEAPPPVLPAVVVW